MGERSERTSQHGEWHAAWVTALTDLEADVAQVEAMITDDHLNRDHPVVDPWTPPTGLGPLPLDLRPRADALLQRQLAAAQNIALALATNRRHAAFADRVESGSAGAPRPSYVDFAA
jgi:hypothetical protein